MGGHLVGLIVNGDSPLAVGGLGVTQPIGNEGPNRRRGNPSALARGKQHFEMRRATLRWVYVQHWQCYLSNVPHRGVLVGGSLGDVSFRQGEVPFHLFLAALEFSSGLPENPLISHLGSGWTAD